MPRIRNLKPQFWDSPDTAEADLAVRLLFMAMWNWADDAGRGTANMKELEAFAFPNDDVSTLPKKPSRGNSATVWRNFRDLCAEVARCYAVTFYRVRGRDYFVIPSFKDHQSKNFKPESSLPGPEEGEVWVLTSENDKDAEEVAEIPQPGAEIPRPIAEKSPLYWDRDRDGDRDGDARPPVLNATSLAISRERKSVGGIELARHLHETARTVEAADIADAFSRSLPVPLETSVVIKVGVEIDKCLRSQIPPDAIANGLRAWLESDSWSPTQISMFVGKANSSPRGGKPTKKALGYQAAADALLAQVGTMP